MNTKDVSQFIKIVESLLLAEEKNPVTSIIKPSELNQEIDLALSDEPLLDDEFYSCLNELVLKSPKTASKRFFNQLIGGRRSKAVLGDIVASLLNHSMYTFKVAGPMVGVEKTIIQKFIQLLAYPESADGTITNGGSMSNFTALVLARDQFLSDCIVEGVHRKMILYTSEESHYSIAKNASLAGIGKNQVRAIPSDNFGRMQTLLLDSAIAEDIEKGNLPFLINVTSGTTVLGAFDSIDEIVEVNKKYKLWLHVDGAYGGATLLTEKYKHLMKGVQYSDSFSISAHKMLGTPLTCSVFVTKHKAQLYESFASDANYLYQTQGDDYNPGKSSFQCGRRNDALKLWTLWKSLGTKGMGKMISHQFELADVARNYVNSNSDYELYSFENSASICFNYKNIDAEKLTQAIYENSVLMVSYGKFKNNSFVRLVTINSDNTKKDILNFFTLLETFVKQNPTLI